MLGGDRAHERNPRASVRAVRATRVRRQRRRRRWRSISSSWRCRRRVCRCHSPSAVELPGGGLGVERQVEQRRGPRRSRARRGSRTSTSTRRSRLRCIMSAEPIQAGRLAAVLEPEDPAVLEEAAQDRAHLDRLGQAGHAGAQRADAADQQLDGHARLRGEVERVDDRLVDDRVGLDPDPGRRGRPGGGRSPGGSGRPGRRARCRARRAGGRRSCCG